MKSHVTFDPGLRIDPNRRLLLVILLLALAVLALGVVAAHADGGEVVPPPQWDKSSIEVSGQCVNGGAEFTVHNSGEAMQGPSAWREYENGTLNSSGFFQLAAGGTEVWTFGPGVGVVEFQADQRPGHPGSSAPRLTLNCSTPTAVTLSTFSASVLGISLAPMPCICSASGRSWPCEVRWAKEDMRWIKLIGCWPRASTQKIAGLAAQVALPARGNRGGCGYKNRNMRYGVVCNVSDSGVGFVSGACDYGYWFDRVSTRRSFRIGDALLVDGCEGIDKQLYAPITISKVR